MVVRAVAVCGLVAGVAACYGPQFTPGLPCAPAGEEPRCPGALVCVEDVCQPEAGAPDAPFGTPDGAAAPDAAPGTPDAPIASIDATPVVDTDGDMVPDSDDDCPLVPDSDQADEDGDGLGDVCDPCPPVAINIDSDGDGVGGPCDPHPGTGGDAIVAFAGFASGIPSTWTVTGAVTTAGGDAVFPSSTTEETLIMPVAAAGAHFVVSALATPTVLETTLGGIGVIQRRGLANTGVVCQLASTSTGTPQDLRLFDLVGGGTLGSSAHEVTIGTSYVLTIARDVDDYLCSASSPSVSFTGTSTSGAAALGVGLRARNAGVHYAWVLVVSSP